MEAQLLRLREQVLIAQQSRRALRLHGGRSKDFYGEDHAPGKLLDLRGYEGIVDYEPAELVITARGGTPLRQIEAALASADQFLGFEPPSFGGEPTIGGVIAAGLSGPRRMQAGAARDFVLGAHLLAADGEVLRFGGQVMKNVAGFDVSRLLCGSLGIFGILTQLSIKVLPRPRMEETRCLELSAADAIRAFNAWGGQPLPISAAAWHRGFAWLRLSGAAAAVRAAGERIGGDRVDEPAAQTWWDSLRHGSHAFFSQRSLWRLSVPSTAAALELPGEPLIEWGGALRWYAGDLDGCDVRGIAAAAGGSAMRWRGSAPAGRFHPVSPALAQIHRRLKRGFDPHGIFNPGRLMPDL